MPTPKWIRFVDEPTARGLKTRRWSVVMAQGNFRLGQVCWFGPWRKYSFYPDPATLFEATCLRDIAEFCEAQTKEHREKAKSNRETSAEPSPPSPV